MYRAGRISTSKTVPIGETECKSREVTACRAKRVVQAGTVQSGDTARQTGWRLRDRSRSAGGGNGQDGLPVLAGSARVTG